MQPRVYTPAMQGTGEFDGGNITEQKPIGFSGEGSIVRRVGPLFYWAWANARTDAKIGLHPHKGFEILTYVIQGNAFHGDTLGTNSTVRSGGVQVMQTGSGVSHQERLSEDAELFQIWFEPELKAAVQRTPSYRQYEHNDFPQDHSAAGSSIKTIIGGDAPIHLVADAEMWDVEISGGTSYSHTVPAGYTLTALAIRGQGSWQDADGARDAVAFHHQDFIVAYADHEATVQIANPAEEILRLVLIKVPTTVNYPLLPKK
ncbi:pirin family protein [Paenibacillus sp. Z6-24]